MVRSMFIPFFCGLALVVAACDTTTTPPATTGTISVNVRATPSGSTPTVNITFSGTGAVDAVTALGDGQTRGNLAPGTYTATVAASSGFTITTDPSPATLTVTAGQTATLTVTYTGASALTKRLYAAGTGSPNANNGVLYLTPNDLNGASATAPNFEPQMKRNPGVSKVAFDAANGNQYQLSAGTTVAAAPPTGALGAASRQTLLKGFTAANALLNVITPIRVQMTNGFYTSGARPGGSDWSLVNPSDIAVRGSNLWVLDPAAQLATNLPTPTRPRMPVRF